MNKFNLTFSGEILPGYDLARAKETFAEILALEDPSLVDHFFTGKSVILLHDLDRKAAAEGFSQLKKVGADVALEKILLEDDPGQSASKPEPEPKPTPKAPPENRGMDHEIREQNIGRIDQSWPISNAVDRPSKKAKQTTKTKAESIAGRKPAVDQVPIAQQPDTQDEQLAKELAAVKEAAELRALKQREEKQAAEEAAEQDERRRVEEEEKALQREEQKRLAAEKKARLKAEREEKARLREQKREEKKRSEEQAKAKRLAKIEAKRAAAEEAERIKEEKAKQKRRELELAAELKARQQQKHAEEFARLKEQKAAEKTRREALERAARERSTQEELRIETLKAEQRRLEAEEIARVQAEKMYQLNQQDLATKIPERRAKIRPSKPSHIDMAQRDLPLAAAESSTVAKDLKTSVEPTSTAEKDRAQKPDNAVDEAANTPKNETSTKRLRSPHAPNFFSLKPFRHTSEIRQRALRSAQLKPIAFTASFIATLALLVLSVRYITLPPSVIANGASAGAVSQQAQLLLISGDQLLIHDRAGVGTYSISLAAIGMTAVSPPIAFAGDHELLIRGKPIGAEKSASADHWQLYRCNLEQPACQSVVLTSAIADVSDLVIDPHSGSFYIADSQSQEIYKTTATGELLAQAKVKVPPRPRIRLHQGLLYLNSDIAPAISVFRPDEQAFGQQLDEILVIPPPALGAQQTKVRDFLWSAGSWWVTLENPESDSSGVYRFDAQWNFLEQIALEENTHPDHLLEWADKTLVLDGSRSEIRRFNADGKAEVLLSSNTLNEHLSLQRESRKTTAALWRFCLTALILVALTSFCAGNLHRLRNLVYRQGKERGAEPIADREKEVTWVPNAGSRDLRYKKVTVAYLALGLIALIATATLTQSMLIVLAIGVALAGPLVALFLLYSTRTGHIGLLGTQLLLVDHQNFYHLGSGPRVYYRKHFIMLDDILVFTGSSLLPVFDSTHLRQKIQPVVTAGIKIDRKTLVIKLLQSAHPLVRGSIACLGCLALATLILLAA